MKHSERLNIFSGKEITSTPELWIANECTFIPLFCARQVIFAEHYPLSQKEKETFQKAEIDGSPDLVSIG